MSERVRAISHFLPEQDEVMPLRAELWRATCYRYRLDLGLQGALEEQNSIQEEKLWALKSHWNLGSFHKHGSHQQQTFPLRTTTHRAAVSCDKWMPLNGIGPLLLRLPGCFLFANFISADKESCCSPRHYHSQCGRRIK